MRTLGKLLSLVIACFILPVAMLLERLWKFRITPFNSSRFGHLATDPQLYLAQKRLNDLRPARFRWFFTGPTCNRQLLNMWQRLFPIYENHILWATYQYALPILKYSAVFRPLPHPNSISRCHELVGQTGALLYFDEEDEKAGRTLLESMGIGEKDWFVCFNGRELARADHSGNRTHRNADISTYLKAALHVAEMGGFAIRVGDPAKNRLPGLEAHPHIIDYAHEYKSEFGDIYLLGKCRFLLGAATGTINVPSLFGRTVAFANMIPYGTHPNPGGLIAPKFLFLKSTGQVMHFRETYAYLMSQSPYMDNLIFLDRQACFENDQVGLIDNTEDDILDLCIDMLDQTAGIPPQEDAIALQRAFKNIFFRDCTDGREFGPDIGPRYAMKYRHLIEA